MGVVNAYKSRKEYSIEPGAQEIVDKLNAEMYSTDPEQLTIWLKELKEKYPKSYETIKKCDPGFINTVQRCIIRDEVVKEAHKLSGKLSL